jgi:hypothetical protein
MGVWEGGQLWSRNPGHDPMVQQANPHGRCQLNSNPATVGYVTCSARILPKLARHVAGMRSCVRSIQPNHTQICEAEHHIVMLPRAWDKSPANATQ